jgi:hypothetical protein
LAASHHCRFPIIASWRQARFGKLIRLAGVTIEQFRDALPK